MNNFKGSHWNNLIVFVLISFNRFLLIYDSLVYDSKETENEELHRNQRLLFSFFVESVAVFIGVSMKLKCKKRTI